MGKKKSAKSPGDGAASALFLTLQSAGEAWYDKEREGIALIEAFHKALAACRDDGGEEERADDRTSGLGGNLQMDPLLAEELFAQVKALPAAFEALLGDMYGVQERARELVEARKSHDDAELEPVVLRTIDYHQFIAQEVAAFEAEFQHVEALLAQVTFEMTPSEMRTLTISWSTSPFLEPQQSREFKARHELSERVRQLARA